MLNIDDEENDENFDWVISSASGCWNDFEFEKDWWHLRDGDESCEVEGGSKNLRELEECEKANDFDEENEQESKIEICCDCDLANAMHFELEW